MRIQLPNTTASSLGSQVADHYREFLDLDPSVPINNNVLLTAEKRFFSLGPKNRKSLFTNGMWDILRPHLPNSFSSKREVLPTAKGPVIIGAREAPDIVYESTISANGDLEITALGYYVGGLASNTTLALRLQGIYAHLISLLGNGEKADLHRSAIIAQGIDLSHAVRSEDDAYTHFCSVHVIDNERIETWQAEERFPFSNETLAQLTLTIETTLKANSGEVLVLSSLPPEGSNYDYFARLAYSAKDNNSPTIFNAKEYDPISKLRPTVNHLFQEEGLRLIKPNLVEFVKFLRYTGFLYEDSDKAEKDIYERLKKQISLGNFKETFDSAKALISHTSPEMIVLLSFGEYGAMAVNKNHAVVFRAPKIDLKCSSGAGDSGLAGVIKTLSDHNLSLWNTFTKDDLEIILKAFIYSASATASLDGNEIAGLETINALKEQKLIGSDLCTAL